MKKKLLALAIGGVLSAGAQADISNILITEYVEGGGYNKAIEITNGHAADTYTFTSDIVIQQKVTQSGSAPLKNTLGSNILDGISIAAGKSIVIVHPDAAAELKSTVTNNGAALLVTGTYAQAGAGASPAWNGDDAVAIYNTATSTIIDVVGLDGTKNTADQTLSRKLVDGKLPAQNVTFDANDWDKLPKDTFTGLGLKPGVAIGPVVPPVVVTECVDSTQTTITEVQGSGWSSPLIADGQYVTDDEYYVTGVVSAVTVGTKEGFYLYASDGDNRTSDGVFVKTKNATSALIGKTVCVKSKVYEDYGMTQLKSDKWEVTNAAAQTITAVPVEIIAEDNESFDATLERYESMLVKFPEDMDTRTDVLDIDGNPIAANVKQNMHVSRTFSFDYQYFRTNMVLSYKRTNMHPNQEYPAGSAESIAQAAQNADYRLILEMNAKSSTPDDLPYYPAFRADPVQNYIRVDDSVTGLEGVVVYRTGYGKPADFALIATDNNPDLKFIHNTDRKDAKALASSLGKVVEGDIEIKVATQNVLNYFNSPFGGDYNNQGDNRGATSYSEYDKQKAKIISAIIGLDADIVGLMEIENNGFGKNGAIAELVNDINLYYDEPKISKKHEAKSTSNRYAFIGFDSNGDVVIDSDDSIGGDAITSGMLYRPEKVSLDAVKIIPMPSQHDKPVVNNNGEIVKNYTDGVLESGDNYMRDSLAATFKINQTGKKLTVAVNHLKSKGSTCAEDWDGIDLGNKTKLAFNEDKALLDDSDYQGSCENFRVAAAVQLGDELAKIGGDTVILGDMNSYAKEEPMLVLTEIPAGTTITAARNTFIGKTPQFGSNGAVITDDYGYINAVSEKDAEKGKMSWSYSYGDTIGSLDHILITSSLKDRLVDAADWHINAPESTLYDYNEDKKGDSASLDAFYKGDVYRSSDHDSAIMVLSYTPAETDGAPVHIVIEGGVTNVPYMIPASAAPQEGDIATITVSPITADLDMSNMLATPTVLAKASRYIWIDGKKVYPINLKPNLAVLGLKTGAYAISISLTRDGASVAGSTVSYNIDVAKTDSLEPKIIVPESDNTGGSFSIFGIMSLLGLGFLRRKIK